MLAVNASSDWFLSLPRADRTKGCVCWSSVECMFEASLGYIPCLNKYLNTLSEKVKGWVHWLCPDSKCTNSHILFSLITSASVCK